MASLLPPQNKNRSAIFNCRGRCCLPRSRQATHGKKRDPVCACTRRGSHGSMVEDCLIKLKQCDKLLKSEIERLEGERQREMQQRVVSSAIIPFPNLPAQTSWQDGKTITLMGSAAARSGHYVIELEGDSFKTITIEAGSAVLATSDSLDPVIKKGQWVLLGRDIESRDAGALAAIDTKNGKYLRRIWSERDRWILQSINPIARTPSISVSKIDAPVRRIVGVLYEPEKFVKEKNSDEWCPFEIDIGAILDSLYAVEVQGQSLAPLAFSGQNVLVGKPLVDPRGVEEGALVVIETSDPQVGIVIKRIFKGQDKYLLLSPNPVDAISPLEIRAESITQIRYLRGVLFEASE